MIISANVLTLLFLIFIVTAGFYMNPITSPRCCEEVMVKNNHSSKV